VEEMIVSRQLFETTLADKEAPSSWSAAADNIVTAVRDFCHLSPVVACTVTEV
jgi:hypothetical protein